MWLWKKKATLSIHLMMMSKLSFFSSLSLNWPLFFFAFLFCSVRQRKMRKVFFCFLLVTRARTNEMKYILFFVLRLRLRNLYIISGEMMMMMISSHTFPLSLSLSLFSDHSHWSWTNLVISRFLHRNYLNLSLSPSLFLKNFSFFLGTFSNLY